MPFKLWSIDESTGSRAGFVGGQDVAKRVCYAQLVVENDFEESCEYASAVPPGVIAERAMKGAIAALLDVAEAFRAKKITLGLGAEHAGCAEFVCSLLYVGFQVVPARRCPLSGGAALLMDLLIHFPTPAFSSDQTCTDTAECSTSAENGYGSDSPDSDFLGSD